MQHRRILAHVSNLLQTITTMQTLIRLQVRIPEALHRRLKSTAAANGKTIETFVIEVFESALKRPAGKHNTAVPTTEQATA